MSKEQAEAFYAKVREDAALKEKVMAITENVSAKLTETAQQEGFDVSADDFKALFEEEGVLDDDALAAVAGGCKSGGCVEICGNFIGHLNGKS